MLNRSMDVWFIYGNYTLYSMEKSNTKDKESALRIGRYGVYWGAAEGEPCEDPLYKDYLKDQEETDQ